MADAFVRAQFMEPPTYGGIGPVPVGAVKAGRGIEILPDGTMNVTEGGGTINNIICTNGIQGGGSNPEVYLALLPPTDDTIGGVRTLPGTGISIDSQGIIRSTVTADIESGTGILVTDLGEGAFRVNQLAATSGVIGGVKVNSASTSGLILQTDGSLALSPPAGGIGGVKAGTGVSIEADGTLNATGSGGTITGVGAGTGLGGGGTTGAVTLYVKPPAGTTIGGVYAGDNIIIDADGKINLSPTAGIQTVTGTLPIQVGGTATDPVISVRNASTTYTGVVQLSNDPSTPNVNTAATSTAVNAVYTTANNALPKAGGTMTGVINFAANQTFPNTVLSTTFTLQGGLLVGNGTAGGYAQLSPGINGQVLTVDSTAPSGLKWSDNGAGTVTSVTGQAPISVVNNTTAPVISIPDATTSVRGAAQLYDGVDSTALNLAATANSIKTTYDYAATKLPLAGGTMTGAIVFNAGQTFPGTLPLAGGAMTGDISFSGTQTFPGVLVNGSIGGTGAIEVGGTPSNPIISVDTATTAQLGVVQPDGTSITIDANGVISATSATGFLALTGGTMTGDIVFAGTQTFPVATTAALGVVQPDGTSITVNGAGVISAVTSVPAPDYGSWYSDNTQTPQALTTGQPVTLNQTVSANGFSLLNGSQITASAAGVYNLQFSIQIISSSGAANVEIWLTKNGVAVANSNTVFSVKNANEAEFAALNYVDTLASGDYLQLYWATDNLNCELAANASTMGGPDIPSVILTIVPVGA